MNSRFYLYVRKGTKYGYPEPIIRVTKTKGNMASDEICIEMNLDIPDALFKRPSLTANITIPDSVVPEEIKAQTMDNIKEALSQAVDLKINFEVEDTNKKAEETN